MFVKSRTSFALLLLLGALPCAASVTCSSTPDETTSANASASSTTSGSGGAGGSDGSGGAGGGPELGWSKSFGDAQDQQGYKLATTPDGGIILSGRFMGKMDLGGDPLDASGDQRLFVSKLTSSGAPVWSLTSGGSSTALIAAQVVDAKGNTILVGNFTGSLELGGGTLVSEGMADVFAAKLSPDGDVLWTTSLGGVTDAFPDDVAVDALGNIYLTGIFSASLKTGVGELVSAGGKDLFLVTLAEDGKPVAAKRFGGEGAADSHIEVEVDAASNVVLAGLFGGTDDFGAGPVQSAGAKDLFIVKYDSKGSYVTGAYFPFEGTGYLETFSMSVDPAGGVVVAGNFGASVDFGGGALAGSSADQNDIFVAKLGADLKHVWSKAFGGSGGDNLRALATSTEGDIFLTGFSTGSEIDFGGGGLSAGLLQMFLAQLDAKGAHVGSDAYGGEHLPNDLIAGKSGFLFVTGEFSDPGLDLGFGALSHAGGSDGFVAKLPVWSDGP
jgi:hypothetical protein